MNEIDDNLLTPLGRFIKTEMEKQGISGRNLCKKAGFTSGTLTKIMRGETKDPGITIILSMAKALKLHPMKLIYAYEGKDPEKWQETSDEMKSRIIIDWFQKQQQNLPFLP